MKRKTISIFLCLALLLGLTPAVPALASDSSSPASIDVSQIPEAGGYDDPMYWSETNRAELTGSTYASTRAASSGKTYDDFSPRSVSGEQVRKGIDVSQWQEEIDWAAVAASGVEFAYIRVGVRGWGLPGTLMKDSNYAENIKNAQANGILVGAYIFSQAITVDEAIDEADHLLALLEGYEMDLPMVMDFEYASTSNGIAGRLYNANLTKDEATAICQAFCSRIAQYGHESMVYANMNMLNDSLNADKLGRVWLAHYATETSYTGDYEFWQCTSNGVMDGINGSVDLDFWFDASSSSGSSGSGSSSSGSSSGSSSTDGSSEGGSGGSSTDGSSGSDGSTVVLPFRDVPEGIWYYSVVSEAYEAGIVKGTTTTTFSPNDTITRCQVVTMLYRMLEEPTVGGSVTFEDVDPKEYYYNAVRWAQQSGYVKGYDSKTFGTNDAIRREDLVTILYRMEGEPAVSGTLSGFTDSGSISDWAGNAMLWAVQQGLLTGYEDHTLRPQGNTSRAEACALIIRYKELTT